MITLGSLFDGISAFPLAASVYGIKTVWASEIEPFPIQVSQKHFPDMRQYGDITKINGAEIEPVDIITFGSPCQDMSVAGKREGLYGERSGLFMEAVRIIREMQEETYGIYPRFAVWENVPGAFSSNRGLDFKAVLEEITESEIPMPQSGKWATSGMVRGNGRSVAWRVLDAQYFGVPQRRRRIFLIADFAGQRAPEILFECQGLCRDTQESRKEGQAVTGSAGDSVKTASYGFISGQSAQARSLGFAEEVSPVLKADAGGNTVQTIAATQRACIAKQTDVDLVPVAFGPGGQHDISHAIRSQPSKADKPSSTTYVVKPQLYDMTHADEVIRTVAPGNRVASDKGITPVLRGGKSSGGYPAFNVLTTGIPIWDIGDRRRVLESVDVAPTLLSKMGTGGNNVPILPQPIPIHDKATRCNGGGPTRNGDGAGNVLGVGKEGDPMPTMTAGDRHAVCSVDCRNLYENEEISGTLQCKQTGGYSLNYQNPVRIGYAVRRLTPTECERLMGFPDGWTDGGSDTARYKALGNSIAVPCLKWIFSQLVK